MERTPPPTPVGYPDPYAGAGYGAGAPPQAASSGETEFDPRKLVGTLWRGRWIILICVVIGGIIGFLTTTQQPVRYQASAKVLFDAGGANVQAGQDVVDSIVSNRYGLNSQIEILRSASLIQRVVDDLGLDRNPRFNPSLRPPPEPTWRDTIAIGPRFNALMIDLGLRSAPPPPPPETPERIAAREERLKRVVIRNVLAGLQLRPVPDTLVLEIIYTSDNPRLSANIANSIAEQYIVDQLEGKLETFRSATQWLTNRVQELQQRVETAEARVLQAQAAITEEAGASLDATREQLAALTSARAAARQEASVLRARYARLREALERETDIGNLPELRDNGDIVRLRERTAELQLADERLAATLLPGHPSRQRIAEELQIIADDLQQEATRALETIRLELETAEAREVQLAEDMRGLEDQALRLSTDNVQVSNLEREAQASRILYQNLLARLQETNAQEDLQAADARILSPAEPPLGPIGTQQQRTFQMSLFLGAALGIGIVFLLDKLNNTFRSAGQLEEILGQPVLATVPAAGRGLKRKEVIQNLREKPNSSLAESIRNLRTSILFSNVDKPPKVVMFSSSVPREGKSSTSMMTALTSRQMGKSAIIVDCDLRMPALSKVLQAGQDTPGLLSVINDTSTVEDAIYVEPDTGLHVLMTRPSERTAKINAADVLASQRFRNLVQELSETYDLVVLDTPPTLVVTDARIVSGLADACVFAVRWDSTPRDAVKEGVKELLSVNAPLIGVVMTMVNEQRASKYAYDGYSYYKGRYRDYYEA